jgi:hypothetical protein
MLDLAVNEFLTLTDILDFVDTHDLIADIYIIIFLHHLIYLESIF